jgi:hypothetical protein
MSKQSGANHRYSQHFNLLHHRIDHESFDAQYLGNCIPSANTSNMSLEASRPVFPSPLATITADFQSQSCLSKRRMAEPSMVSFDGTLHG